MPGAAIMEPSIPQKCLLTTCSFVHIRNQKNIVCIHRMASGIIEEEQEAISWVQRCCYRESPAKGLAKKHLSVPIPIFLAILEENRYLKRDTSLFQFLLATLWKREEVQSRPRKEKSETMIPFPFPFGRRKCSPGAHQA